MKEILNAVNLVVVKKEEYRNERAKFTLESIIVPAPDDIIAKDSRIKYIIDATFDYYNEKEWNNEYLLVRGEFLSDIKVMI